MYLWTPLIQGDVDGNKVKCKTRTDQNMRTDCPYFIKGSEQGRPVPRGWGEGTGTKGLDPRLGSKGEEGSTANAVCPTPTCPYYHVTGESSRMVGEVT